MRRKERSKLSKHQSNCILRLLCHRRCNIAWGKSYKTSHRPWTKSLNRRVDMKRCIECLAFWDKLLLIQRNLKFKMRLLRVPTSLRRYNRIQKYKLSRSGKTFQSNSRREFSTSYSKLAFLQMPKFKRYNLLSTHFTHREETILYIKGRVPQKFSTISKLRCSA